MDLEISGVCYMHTMLRKENLKKWTKFTILSQSVVTAIMKKREEEEPETAGEMTVLVQ